MEAQIINGIVDQPVVSMETLVSKVPQVHRDEVAALVENGTEPDSVRFNRALGEYAKSNPDVMDPYIRKYMALRGCPKGIWGAVENGLRICVWQTANKFDAGEKSSFGGYLVNKLKWEYTRLLREEMCVIRPPDASGRRAMMALAEAGGDSEEVEGNTKLTSQVRSLARSCFGYTPLDSPIGEDGDGSRVMDVIPDRTESDVRENDRFEMAKEVMAFLKGETSAARAVKARFGLTGRFDYAGLWAQQLSEGEKTGESSAKLQALGIDSSSAALSNQWQRVISAVKGLAKMAADQDVSVGELVEQLGCHEQELFVPPPMDDPDEALMARIRDEQAAARAAEKVKAEAIGDAIAGVPVGLTQLEFAW